MEVCGNCRDDDDDGALDYEDDDCCTVSAALEPTSTRLRGGRFGLRTGRLRLRARLGGAAFTSVNPLLEDVALQLRNEQFRLLCTTFPRAGWKRTRTGFKFRDATGDRSGGIVAATLRVPRNGGPVQLDVRSRSMNLLTYFGAELTTTLAVGDRCADGTAPLRQRGKGLVFP